MNEWPNRGYTSMLSPLERVESDVRVRTQIVASGREWKCVYDVIT